jgi:hypothetical protein
MSRGLLVSLLGMASLLSACAQAGASSAAGAAAEPSAATAPAEIQAGIDPFASGNGLTRIDNQGAIVVEVTPVNLDGAATQLEFTVVLNTHSIDLSMDLASLATMTTDTGLSVAAKLWDAPLGGHHTSGRLIFPLGPEALPLLSEASRLTLTIIDLDAPSRVFEWELK